MKVLLDSCISKNVRQHLVDAGHDVVWIGDNSKDPGDNEILSQAGRENRVLVTLDKDFGEMVVLSGRHHHGIVRLVNSSATHQAKICLDILQRYGPELQTGALITAELGRVRIRMPDILE